ncbi:MAG: glycosyltransferase family 2 protein, partial [candidate division Zixibacteria bacterium]
RLFPEAKLIGSGKNIGFAAACNLAAGQAVGEYLLFLNPDVIVEPDSILTLLQVGRERFDAGLIVPRLAFPNGSFQANCRRFPTASNMIFSRRSALSRLTRFLDSTGKYTLPDSEETSEVEAVAATLALVKRSLFEEVGRFDQRFFLYMEDTDLSLRINQSGRVNLFVPSVTVLHHWGEGSKASYLYRASRHHWSVWQYFLKHHPNGFALVVLPLLLTINYLLTLASLPFRKDRN